MAAAPTPRRFDDADFVRFTVSPAASMHDVLTLIDGNGEGVALVVEPDRRLVGIVTDGDVRRAILAGADFAEPVSRFLERKADTAFDRALTAPADARSDDLLRLMTVRLVRHLPLIDDDGRLVGLALKSELGRERDLPLRAVVMAGGYGVRLKPFTDATPKPMLRVGDKPVIEHILGQLRGAGVRKVCVTTHYRAEKITEHVGDGAALGLEVQYTFEEKPLGTAGALSMLAGTPEPLLVVNGDVLTGVDYRALLSFHRENGSDLTVAVRRYEIVVPFGVVEAEGSRVRRLTEKPTVAFFINAGIYLLEPAVLGFIRSGERLDMTDLIDRVIAGGGIVISFPVHEDWLDIGDVDAYVAAPGRSGDTAGR